MFVIPIIVAGDLTLPAMSCGVVYHFFVVETVRWYYSSVSRGKRCVFLWRWGCVVLDGILGFARHWQKKVMHTKKSAVRNQSV